MRNDNINSSLVLNISRIQFENAEMEVGVFPYEGEQQFNALRNEYVNSHVLRRERNCVTAIPVVTDAGLIGNTKKTIRLGDNLYLVATLVRHALINFLYKIGRPSPTYVPVKIIGGKDLIAESVPNITCPSWLSVRTRFIVETRVVDFGSAHPFLGLVVDLETARLIEKSCADLLAEDFALEGLYVGSLTKPDDARLSPRLSLLGCVSSVSNGVLTLEDSRDDIKSVASSEVLLDPRSDSFDRCLRHIFKDRASQIKSAIDKHLAEERSGPNRLRKLGSIIQHLTEKKLEIIPGVPITFEPFLSQENVRTFPTIKKARPTVYVFDPTGSRTNTWHDGGLNEHGPYTRNYFTPSRPRVCVICQKNQKGLVEQFLHKFQEGVKPINGGKAYFAKGLVRKYALDGISFEFYLTDNATPDAYYRAARQAIQENSQSKWDLGLIQIEEKFHQLYGGDNPYLIAKSMFLMHQIPTQAFESETMAMPDSQIGFALNNMALATYAKMNGIPWLVKADPTIAQEFVVGLGSAYVGKGRLGDRERVVGITTVFKGDGNYFLSNLSQAVSIQDYQQALLSSLRMTIEKVRQDMNWQPREKVRLIFHSFKPMKYDEADAVKELVKGLGDYSVDYAFLHIKDNHPYLLFDKNQRGANDFSTRKMKGVMAPSRSLYFPLSERETLLTLTGPNELKRPEDGMPHPVLLSLHPNSNFEDMNYLAQQVYTFSCHSWRSFFPAPMPVTILYSDLVAGLLGKLADVPRWSSDAMLGHIGTTRWFL